MKKENGSDRRQFLAATGGALIAVGSAGLFEASAQHHKKAAFKVGNDPLGSATVSFGGWMADFTPPLDRFTTEAPPPSNHHELIPNTAKIKAGGYVNFIISGFHVVAIYDDGHKPTDIDASITVHPGGPLPPFVRIISDTNRRIYRGLNPVSLGTTPVVDRVEVVQFAEPGTYLVICAVNLHFAEGMFGYVKVLSEKQLEAGG